MKIIFDDNNTNVFYIYDENEKDKNGNDKLINMITCPPCGKFGCDIIDFNKDYKGFYTYKFKGLIIITTPLYRKIYSEGLLIAKSKRRKNKNY